MTRSGVPHGRPPHCSANSARRPSRSSSGASSVRAVVYSETGGPEVLRLVERTVPEPGAGEVRVQVSVSGVNPTDWKSRQGRGGAPPFAEVVPNQDGAGTIDAVGEGVDAA